ncbi:MAG: hypothetical protein ACI4NN_02105 [Pyramidobacter sp.]
MEIKYKLYPYPVLSPFSNDYQSGIFDASIEPVFDGYNIRIDFAATLSCSSLVEMIKTGKAKYVYHLECAQTGFRTIHQTDRISDSYMLLSKQVNGKLQVSPFIVAVEDIKGYTSKDFHDDYNGFTFDIEAGCVMAVGKTIEIDVSKKIDDLADTPSVFCIIRNADVKCRQMLIRYEMDKIVIMLPADDYYSYKQLRKTPQTQAILNSLTIIPALTYVLEEIQKRPAPERSDFADLLWYRTLSRSMNTIFDCDVESPKFDNVNCIELAQKLIDNPISESFKMLANMSGGDDE